jgi:DNA-binding transcriptional regulator YiaG
MTETIDAVLQKAKVRRDLPGPGLRRAIRKQAHLTLLDVAQAINVGAPAVSRYEKGEREPRGKTRELYSHLLSRLSREVVG